MKIQFLHLCRICQQTFPIRAISDVHDIRDAMRHLFNAVEAGDVLDAHACGDPVDSQQCGVTDLIGARVVEETDVQKDEVR